MSWVRSGSVCCKCVPYQDKHILGSGGDSQSVSTVFSGFLVASIPWRIVRQSVKVTDRFLSFLFNLIVFRIFISKGRALNKLYVWLDSTLSWRIEAPENRTLFLFFRQSSACWEFVLLLSHTWFLWNKKTTRPEVSEADPQRTKKWQNQRDQS